MQSTKCLHILLKTLLIYVYFLFISLIGNTPEAQSDSVFEAANLLMNLAFWHMKHSAMLAVKPDLDMEEAKKCHTSLRKAAGNYKKGLNRGIYSCLYSILLGIIIRKLKVDFMTGGTWHQVRQ